MKWTALNVFFVSNFLWSSGESFPILPTMYTCRSKLSPLSTSSPVTLVTTARATYSNALCLFQKKNDKHEGDKDDVVQTILNVDFGVMTSDLVSLALAFQFMGLLDVLQDPVFWSKGGWFQAIPLVPSSLPTLIRRFSLNSVVYLALGVAADTLSTNRVSSMEQLQKTALKIAVGFLVIRLLVIALLSVSLTGNLEGIDTNIIGQLLRECYFVVAATTASRYVLYSLYFKD